MSTFSHVMPPHISQPKLFGNPLDEQAFQAICSPKKTRWNSSTLIHWQLSTLRDVCSYAKNNSTFYDKQFASFSTDGITSLDEFAALPRTTAADIGSAPYDFLCTSQDEIARIVTLTTSGSTSSPKRIFFTKDELQHTVDFFSYGMQCLVSSGEKVLALLPAPRPDSVGALLQQGLDSFGAHSVLHQNPDDLTDVFEHFLAEQPHCIVGTPAHVLALAKLCACKNIAPSNIRSVLLCWDESCEPVRNAIADIFNCRVHTHWGMTETGLGGGVSCAHGNGIHIRETELFVEITDPETGRCMPDGEFGEIVVTTLTRTGMPLIRYRTGDLSRIMTDQCSCCSMLRRLDPHISRLPASAAKHAPIEALSPTLLDSMLLPQSALLVQDAWFSSSTNALHVDIVQLQEAAISESEIQCQIKQQLPDCCKQLSISCTVAPLEKSLKYGFAKRKISLNF